MDAAQIEREMSRTRESIDRRLDALSAQRTQFTTLGTVAAVLAVTAAGLGLWWWRRHGASARRAANHASSAAPWARSSETSGYAVDAW